MEQLDEKDLEILRLLSMDARRSYRELASEIDLSPPAVSNRIDRLKDQDVIRKFTLDIDRTKLQSRTLVLVELEPKPDAVSAVYRNINEDESTEHIYRLSDGRILFHANAPDRDYHAWINDIVDFGDLNSYNINSVLEYDWNVNIDPCEFSIQCVVCDNYVNSDGVTAKVNGDIKSFCCPSCKAHYEEKLETLRERQ